MYFFITWGGSPVAAIYKDGYVMWIEMQSLLSFAGTDFMECISIHVADFINSSYWGPLTGKISGSPGLNISMETWKTQYSSPSPASVSLESMPTSS